MEILCVDDCSSDDTLEILDSFAKQDDRIRIEVNSKNLGLVGNWNRCVELSKGDWIKFVFQDDLILPNCIERMLSSMRDCPLIVCQRKFIFDDNTDPKLRQWYMQLDNLCTMFPRQPWVSPEEICAATLQSVGRNFFGEPTSTLLHRSVFERFGTFNPNLVMMCDSEYWTRIAIHTGVTVIPDVLVNFRVHEGATSAVNRSARRYRADVLDQLILFHDFALATQYRPLQDFAQEHSPRINLRHCLSKAAKAARASAEDAAGTPQDPNGLRLAEWSSHLRRYPELEKFLEPSITDLFFTLQTHACRASRSLRGLYDRHIAWRLK